MQLSPDYRRILKTLRHEEPDRVPLAEFLIDPPVKRAVLGRPVRDVASDVEFWHKAGYDYIFLWPEYPLPGVNKEDLGQSTTDERVTARPHTAGTAGKGRISSMADVEAYPWPNPETIDFSQWAEAARLLPAGMGIMSGETGTLARCWLLTGFEQFSYMLYDQPDVIKALFDHIGSLQCAVIRRLVKLDKLFAIWNCCDMGYTEGLMISPKHMRKYLFPWLEEMISIAHAAGKPFLLHSDGRLYDILEDLLAMGIDALNPIEPKGMDINDLKARYGRRLTLIGNIDMGFTLVRGTPDDVRAEVRQRIKDLAPGGGYAVSSSNSIADYVPVENYDAMRQATFDYGAYPINL